MDFVAAAGAASCCLVETVWLTMSQNADTLLTETPAPAPPVVEPATPAVAPQPAAPHARLQRDLGNAAVVRSLIQRKAQDGGPPPAPTQPVAPRIVDDRADAVPGQMHKTAFLTQLRTSVCNAAAATFRGTRWSEEGCPYIDRVFAYCATLDSERLERFIRRYAPETAAVTTAAELIPIITARVQRSLATWVRTGQLTGVPEDIPVSMLGSGLFGAVAGIASGLAAGIANTFSNVGNLFFKHENGSTGDAVDPVAVQSQLNQGRSLDAGVRTQMESAFGRSFGDVQVHTDPTATTLARDLRARAFTVGNDIAFASGQYQPGTLIGDALIAHELAHVAQQSGAADGNGLMQKGHDRHDAFEEEADQAAIGVVASTWASTEALAKLGRPTISNLRSGLRLQRCDIDTHVRPAPNYLSTEEMNQRGFRLVEPEGEFVVGRELELRYTAPATIRATGTPDPYSFGRWVSQQPGGTEVYHRESIGYSHSFTLDAPGDWYFRVEIPLGQNERGALHQWITVRTADEIAQERIGRVSPTDPTGFLVRLEMQNIQNIHMGVANQNFGGAYISLQGDNPATAHSEFPDIPSNRYTVHPPPNVTPARYQWVAAPTDLRDYPTRGRFGQNRDTIAGHDGFNLGTATTSQWPLGLETGIVEIYCIMYDAQNRVIAEARYHQVILTDEEHSRALAFQSYMTDAKEYLRRVRQDSAINIPGIHITTETGAVNELSLFLGQAVSGSGLKLVDLTPGVAVREYSGSNFTEILESFNDGNSYPPGQIRLRVPANNYGIQAQDWTIRTTGASFSQRLSTGWGWASLGLAALGVVAAIVPGTQGLAPVFFMASAGLGAASAAASLYQRSQEAHPSGTGIIIDIASLAGSLLGLAGAANVLRYGPRVAALTRTGRFVLYTGFATDAMGGVFILAEGAQEIAAVLEGHGTPEQKSAAVTRILAGLLINGSLLAWGARDLVATRGQLNRTLGTELTQQLAGPDLHALSVLEGPALSRLAGSSVDEVREVAALIRQDPVRAAMLIERYGEGFVVAARSHPVSIEEIAQALHAGGAEAAGTRGVYGPVTPGARRPAYEMRAGSGQSSPGNLASRIRSIFTNQTSSSRRVLLHGAILTEVPGNPTGYLLTIPADATHAQIIIPVRIESMANMPTSVHGAETGPARMEIRSTVDASGAVHYEASIEVHRDLAQTDVRYAVGHELDEITQIARSGVRGADITAQKRASLLRAQAVVPGQPVPSITAHDLAEAREFADAVRQRSPQGHPTRSGQYGMPDDLFTRALTMGFGSTAYVEEKIILLRSAGVDEDMLRRLRTMAHHAEITAALPAASSLVSTQVVGHLLHSSPGTPASPIGGLHLDSALLAHQADLVANNRPTQLVRTADSPRSVGGVTYNAYEQWRWTGGGTPPAGSRPTTPGGTAGATHNGWVLAAEPKTTFDNPGAFLNHADQTFRAWSATQSNLTGTNVWWSHTLSGGQSVAGYFNVDASGRITHISVFPLRNGGIASW